jgi:hypothetical protein
MIAQKAAQGLMLIREREDYKLYKVECQCTDPDHAVTFEVSAEDWDEVNLSITTRQQTAHWSDPFNEFGGYHDASKWKPQWLKEMEMDVRSFLNGVHHRVAVTYQLWRKGYIEYHSDTILNSQQALNLSATLKQAVKDIQKMRTECLSKEKAAS